VSKYAKAARDIIELLEGPPLNEVLFRWLAERLAGLDERPVISGDRFYRFVERNSD
jgi:hypothetical protein